MVPRKKGRRSLDPLAAYRRIRKPMPPPERVIPDKRRKAADRAAEQEVRDADGNVSGGGT